MHRFWGNVLQPIFKAENIKTVVEVGSDTGENTRNLLNYAKEIGGKLYAIDPFPSFPADEWVRQSYGKFIMYQELSLSVLPLIKDADAILIDGDHNWYTVYNELLCIAKTYPAERFPLILFHDVGWPYARRDMYYNPNNIPAEYRQAYEKKGLRPESLLLVDDGINANLNNAVYINNPHNGVRTAIEDFMEEHSELEAQFHFLGGLNGLGILTAKNQHREAVRIFMSGETARFVIEITEKDRLQKHVERDRARKNEKKAHERIHMLESNQLSNEKLKNEIENLTSENTELKKESKKLLGDKEILEQEINEHRAEKDGLRNELNEQKTEAQSLRDKLNQQETEKQSLKNELKKQDSEKKQAIQIAEAYQKQCMINANAAQMHENSFRYRIGTLVIDSTHSASGILKLPFNLGKLWKQYKNQKEKITPAPAVKATLNLPVPSSKGNDEYSDHQGVSLLSSDDVAERFQSFYHYSSLKPKLYPHQSSDDLIVEAYMKNAEALMLDIYRNCKHETVVSIIMPTYNRADIIHFAIDSVLSQTYPSWELLVVDDSSTDNTEEVVRAYCQTDSRIKYLKNAHPKGVCGARNTGLEVCTGDFIAYLDSDNDWNENYLLLMTNVLKANGNYSALYCAQAIFNASDKSHNDFQYIRFGAYNHSIIKNSNYIDMNCYMHRRTLYKKLGGFSEELTRFVDWELIHRYSERNYPYALPCCLSNYYFDRSGNQITSKSADEYAKKLSAFDHEIMGEHLNLHAEQYLDMNGYKLYSDKIKKYECAQRKISIIIPSYEALHCLTACVEAINKFSSHMDYEIIIVDNNSSDQVKAYLRELEQHNENIKIVLNEHNMGFTYAVNQGIQLSANDSDIILLNNDAIVTDGWIEELYRVKDTVNAGIIVPRQVLIPNTKTMSTHVPSASQKRELDVSISAHHQNVIDLRKYEDHGFIKLSFAPFFLVMITRECFNELGYLDEKNGRHYKSDRLYCQKAAESNIEIVYTPYAKAYHLLQQSTATLKAVDPQMFKTMFVKNDWSDISYKSSLSEK